MGPEFFLRGTPRRNRRFPVASENFRSPEKRPEFFWRKFQAECGFPVVTPFGDYNIKGGEDAPEIPEISSWRHLQHCTGAPWPNGNRTSMLLPDLCGPDFLIQRVDHRERVPLVHLLRLYLKAFTRNKAHSPFSARPGWVRAQAICRPLFLVGR